MIRSDLAIYMVVVSGRSDRWSGFTHVCYIRMYWMIVWLCTWFLYQDVLIGGLALHMVVASGRTDRCLTSVFHASGSGKLQANPHVASPWLSPGKPTRRTVTTMGSNDLVVGEDHMLGPSCQRYNWQTGRCRLDSLWQLTYERENSDFKPPLSCGSIHMWKRLQEITSMKNQEWSP